MSPVSKCAVRLTMVVSPTGGAAKNHPSSSLSVPLLLSNPAIVVFRCAGFMVTVCSAQAWVLAPGPELAGWLRVAAHSLVSQHRGAAWNDSPVIAEGSHRGLLLLIYRAVRPPRCGSRPRRGKEASQPSRPIAGNSVPD